MTSTQRLFHEQQGATPVKDTFLNDGFHIEKKMDVLMCLWFFGSVGRDRQTMVNCCLAPWWLTTSSIPNYYRSRVGNMNMPINLYIYYAIINPKPPIETVRWEINHQWHQESTSLAVWKIPPLVPRVDISSIQVHWGNEIGFSHLETETYVISRGPSPVAK